MWVHLRFIPGEESRFGRRLDADFVRYPPFFAPSSGGKIKPWGIGFKGFVEPLPCWWYGVPRLSAPHHHLTSRAWEGGCSRRGAYGVWTQREEGISEIPAPPFRSRLPRTRTRGRLRPDPFLVVCPWVTAEEGVPPIPEVTQAASAGVYMIEPERGSAYRWGSGRISSRSWWTDTARKPS